MRYNNASQPASTDNDQHLIFNGNLICIRSLFDASIYRLPFTAHILSTVVVVNIFSQWIFPLSFFIENHDELH